MKQLMAGMLIALIVSTGSNAQTLYPPATAQDTPFQQQKLVLSALPRPAGPKVALFNGKDLADWEGWLGYTDPALTYRAPKAAPIGAVQSGDAFRVVKEDGRPAIYIAGKTWGSLVRKGDFGNYHLRLEFKWGPGRWAPRENAPPNNGLLYHSHGAPGTVFGTWRKSIEFEIMEGSVGMGLAVGQGVKMRTFAAVDPSIASPHRRFMIGGREIDVAAPVWNVEAGSNAERPAGQWNTLDLYVVGDRAIHVVNGVPVMETHDLRYIDAAGNPAPLTHGQIQLQSEGAETFFRNIVLTPINRLPKVSVAQMPKGAPTRP